MPFVPDSKHLNLLQERLEQNKKMDGFMAKMGTRIGRINNASGSRIRL